MTHNQLVGGSSPSRSTMMMLDADSLVGLVVEDHENRVFEIIGFYMVLDSPNPITYIKLKDLDKKTFLNKTVKLFESELKTKKLNFI